MKLVSKKWQDLKDDKRKTEKYEYLSMRDREVYAELKKFWESNRKAALEQNKILEMCQNEENLAITSLTDFTK